MISSFDIAKLHSLLKDFYQLTKIRITVFDDSFRELTSYPDEIADFCKLIRQTPGCAMKCHLCDRHACEIASRRTSSYTYHCHAGLTESIIPIRMGNIVIGYLLFGHVFSYTSYDEGWKVIRERDVLIMEFLLMSLRNAAGSFQTFRKNILIPLRIL